VTPDWNTYLLWVGTDAAGNLEVWTLVNSTWTGPIASGSVGASFPMAIETTTSGTTLTVRVNNSVVSGLSGVAVPAPPSNATDAGMYVDTTGAVWGRLDGFSVAP
jgi:hypothetical protein